MSLSFKRARTFFFFFFYLPTSEKEYMKTKLEHSLQSRKIKCRRELTLCIAKDILVSLPLPPSLPLLDSVLRGSMGGGERNKCGLSLVASSALLLWLWGFKWPREMSCTLSDVTCHSSSLGDVASSPSTEKQAVTVTHWGELCCLSFLLCQTPVLLEDHGRWEM